MISPSEAEGCLKTVVAAFCIAAIVVAGLMLLAGFMLGRAYGF